MPRGVEYVRQAVIGAAATFLGNTPTQWGNVALQRQPQSTWVVAEYVPGARQRSSATEDQLDGELRLSYRYRRDAGTQSARTGHTAIAAAFSVGKVFSSGEQRVRITHCGRSPARTVDNWYEVTTTVGWRAYVPR